MNKTEPCICLGWPIRLYILEKPFQLPGKIDLRTQVFETTARVINNHILLPKTIGGNKWFSLVRSPQGNKQEVSCYGHSHHEVPTSIRWEVPRKSSFQPTPLLHRELAGWPRLDMLWWWDSGWKSQKQSQAEHMGLWLRSWELAGISTFSSHTHQHVSNSLREVSIREGRPGYTHEQRDQRLSAGYGVRSCSGDLHVDVENLPVAPSWGQWERAAWDIPSPNQYCDRQ